jgi:hypothetical protein
MHGTWELASMKRAWFLCLYCPSYQRIHLTVLHAFGTLVESSTANKRSVKEAENVESVVLLRGIRTVAFDDSQHGHPWASRSNADWSTKTTNKTAVPGDAPQACHLIVLRPVFSEVPVIF